MATLGMLSKTNHSGINTSYDRKYMGFSQLIVTVYMFIDPKKMSCKTELHKHLSVKRDLDDGIILNYALP